MRSKNGVFTDSMQAEDAENLEDQGEEEEEEESNGESSDPEDGLISENSQLLNNNYESELTGSYEANYSHESCPSRRSQGSQQYYNRRNFLATPPGSGSQFHSQPQFQRIWRTPPVERYAGSLPGPNLNYGQPFPMPPPSNGLFSGPGPRSLMPIQSGTFPHAYRGRVA